MKIDRGMIHVYTGDGKGKTTASLGLALRALGWGLKVIIIQFIKGYKEIGEIKFADIHAGNFTVRQFAIDMQRDIDAQKVLARKAEAAAAMAFAEQVVSSGEYDLVILDEVTAAVHYKLIETERVLALMNGKPRHVELVLTGRDAPEQIIMAADYATEMKLLKHPYQQGIQARPGVDY
jgi:cob(I)alamin adenosyltransferase